MELRKGEVISPKPSTEPSTLRSFLVIKEDGNDSSHSPQSDPDGRGREGNFPSPVKSELEDRSRVKK